ncbi:MAG: hypothetical protein ACTSXX_00925 [Candidatus Baldrarchaeia archaeon]
MSEVLGSHSATGRIRRGSRSSDPDGSFRMGGIVVVDEEGYILIVDRLKEVIKSGSEQIFSITLEDLISKYPAAVEVTVIAVRGSEVE